MLFLCLCNEYISLLIVFLGQNFIFRLVFILVFVMQNKEFVLNYCPPAGFPKRKSADFWTCAHYTLKAVIEAKTWENKRLRDYNWWWWSRTTYFMTPRSLLAVLRKHGLECKVLRCRFMRKDKRLECLKKEILDWPVVLAVANWLTKKKYFSRMKALMHWHYISLWWFDDVESCFYVYDSSSVREVDKDLKIWTIKIPYMYILKSWSLWFYKIFSSFWIAVKY